MARLEVSPRFKGRLDAFINDYSLPADTKQRVGEILEALQTFPLMGPPLEGRWVGRRSILGPWNWMLIVYAYDEDADLIAVATLHDARRKRTARAES